MTLRSWRKGNIMRAEIHPNYNVVTVTCSTCGKEHEIGTTAKQLRIDTCGNCHPFYTGSQQFTVAAGRVDRFNKRYNINKDKKEEK